MEYRPFVSIQDHYNLLDREEEREVHPLCADQGIGVLPWSPLARGRLARPVDVVTQRSRNDGMQASGIYDGEADQAIIDQVGAIAETRGVSRAQVALAWIRRHPVVTAPIIGVGSARRLDESIAALDIDLTDNEVAALESPYRPRAAALSMMG